MEQDEPCVLALYCKSQAQQGGFALASCYGARPAHLVRWDPGDPHHPIHGELSLCNEKHCELREKIKKVRDAAARNRLIGIVAQIQSRRERGGSTGDAREGEEASTAGADADAGNPNDGGGDGQGSQISGSEPLPLTGASPPAGYSLRCHCGDSARDPTAWKGFWTHPLHTTDPCE